MRIELEAAKKAALDFEEAQKSAENQALISSATLFDAAVMACEFMQDEGYGAQLEFRVLAAAIQREKVAK
jgi:hypothetical protein